MIVLCVCHLRSVQAHLGWMLIKAHAAADGERQRDSFVFALRSPDVLLRTAFRADRHLFLHFRALSSTILMLKIKCMFGNSVVEDIFCLNVSVD